MEYPAMHVVHWPTGPTYACDKHAAALVNLGRVLGTHIALTMLTEERECANCVNEAKEKKDSLLT